MPRFHYGISVDRTPGTAEAPDDQRMPMDWRSCLPWRLLRHSDHSPLGSNVGDAMTHQTIDTLIQRISYAVAQCTKEQTTAGEIGEFALAYLAGMLDVCHPNEIHGAVNCEIVSAQDPDLVVSILWNAADHGRYPEATWHALGLCGWPYARCQEAMAAVRKRYPR